MTMYHLSDAEAIYKQTIATLKERCQGLNSKGDMSLSAFCAEHNIDRSNLTHILNEKQEISVALFMKISAILAGTPAPVLPDGLERWSLRTWLQVDGFAIQGAMYKTNFQILGKS